jgi:hypothetical protein
MGCAAITAKAVPQAPAPRTPKLVIGFIEPPSSVEIAVLSFEFEFSIGLLYFRLLGYTTRKFTGLPGNDPAPSRYIIRANRINRTRIMNDLLIIHFL